MEGGGGGGETEAGGKRETDGRRGTEKGSTYSFTDSLTAWLTD